MKHYAYFVSGNQFLSIWWSYNFRTATAYVSIREATEDTVLVIPNPIGQEGSTTISVAKGTQVVVDWIGIGESHLNALGSKVEYLTHGNYQSTIIDTSKIPLNSSLPGGIITRAKS